MSIYLPLPVVLAALVICGLIVRNRLAAATAGIMLGNWGACTIVCLLTNDFYPVFFFMVADYMSGMAVFVTRRTHWQSAIMAVYAAQLTCHAAYALSSMDASATYYSYWTLTYMAWAQAALIGGWIGTDFVGRWLPLFGSRHAEARSNALAREKSR